MKLIENALVVTMDPAHNIYDRGDIVICDGRIDICRASRRSASCARGLQRDRRRVEPDCHAGPD